jgi:hypothetical protein
VRVCSPSSLPAGTAPRIAHRRDAAANRVMSCSPSRTGKELPSRRRSWRKSGQHLKVKRSRVPGQLQVLCDILLLFNCQFKMRTAFTKVGAAALLASTASAQLYPGQSKLNHTCQLQTPLLSCPPSDPSKVDSCCVETFGGLVLSTQFWNTYTGGSSIMRQIIPITKC